MRLKRVKIFGFKRLPTTEIDLDGDIIAIVGPNGCGKSNIVDAILWGLGEGNARQLRALHNQDVIFNGSSKRKSLGYAEVTLLFDNEDGLLPIQTSEVSVTRRLNRAGDTDYMINRQSCRLRDILDLMADSGLGRSGYAIVGQEEIDQALAASAEDQQTWVDEAAGVQRYRSRKLDSLKRLSAATGHLERVNDILHEIETQREPLRKEAEDALKYKTALGALRQVESGLLIKEVAGAVRDVASSRGVHSKGDDPRAGGIREGGRHRRGDQRADIRSALSNRKWTRFAVSNRNPSPLSAPTPPFVCASRNWRASRTLKPT